MNKAKNEGVFLRDFLKEILFNENQSERIDFYFTKLDNYLKENGNTHEFPNCIDIVKLLEATLLFVDKTCMNDDKMDTLIIILLFIKKIISSIKDYMDPSKLFL